jgi:hypothetical protein
MTKLIAATVFAAFLLSPAVTGQAHAQARAFGFVGGSPNFVGPGGSVTLAPGYTTGAVAPGLPSPAFTYTASYVPPYSYYAAIQRGIPARTYIGYGAEDYPFYGRPYGKPTDPWSWAYISGGYRNALAHYYYPPLGW